MSAKKSSKKRSDKPSAGPHGPMDVEFLQQIVKVMSANDLNTVDLRDGQRRVVLKRGTAGRSTANAVGVSSASAGAPLASPFAPAPIVPAAGTTNGGALSPAA